MRLKCPAALPSGTKQYALLPPSPNTLMQQNETMKKVVTVSVNVSAVHQFMGGRCDSC